MMSAHHALESSRSSPDRAVEATISYLSRSKTRRTGNSFEIQVANEEGWR